VRPARGLNWQRVILEGGGGTVPRGDLSGYSEHWEPRCTEPRDAMYWGDMLDEQWIVLGNDNHPTDNWRSRDIMGKIIIDLTLVKGQFR